MSTTGVPFSVLSTGAGEKVALVFEASLSGGAITSFFSMKVAKAELNFSAETCF